MQLWCKPRLQNTSCSHGRHRPLDCCISHGPEPKMRLGKGTWGRAKVQSKGIQLPAPFQEQEMEEALDSTRTALSRWAGSRVPRSSILTTNWLLTFSKICFSLSAMDSPFLFFILFFSNLLQAYIFPVARTWQAQTCELSRTIAG